MVRPDPAEDPTDRGAPSRGPVSLLTDLLGLTRSPRPGRSRLVLAALSLAVLAAALLWLLPRALDLELMEILDSLGAVSPLVLLAALVLGASAVLLEAVGARAALPGAPWGTTVRAQAAANATGLVIPGGSLLGIAITGTALRRRSVPMRTIASGIAAFSVADLLLGGVAIPLLALLAYGLLGAGHDLPGSVWAVVLAVLGAAITLAALTLVLHRPTAARIVGALSPTLTSVLELTGRGGEARAGTADIGDSVLGARDLVAQLLRRRGARILAPMVLGRLCQFGVLWIAVDALAPGAIDGGPLALLGVFLIGRTIALVPVTPGGGGITETVIALLLSSLGAAPAASATIALVLGAATWLVPIVLGAALGALELGTGRRSRRLPRRTA